MSKIHHALKRAELHRSSSRHARWRGGNAFGSADECALASQSEVLKIEPRGLPSGQGTQPLDKAPSLLEAMEESVHAAPANLEQTRPSDQPGKEPAHELVQARETLLREFEERVRDILLSLAAHVERPPTKTNQGEGQRSEKPARETVGLQLAQEEAHRRSESRQRQLEEQLLAFEKRVRDILVDARGQLQGSVQYALESSLAQFEERARRAEERVAAAAIRSMQTLNEILAVARSRARGNGFEAGPAAPLLRSVFCPDLQAAGSGAQTGSRSANSDRKPSHRKYL